MMNWKMEQKIETFYFDSRKVVNGSRSRVGGSWTRPCLGFACKHLTWIFRSLVSPAPARPWPGLDPAQSLFLSWHRQRLGPARPATASLVSSLSVSVKISPEALTEPGPGASPADQDQDRGLSHLRSVILTPLWSSSSSPSSDPHFAGLHRTS